MTGMFQRMPMLRPLRAARRLLGRVRRRLRDWYRGETAATCFDLSDLRALNDLLVAHGVPPLHTDPRQADTGVPGAIRFVVGLLASRPDLRRRFAPTLGDGEASSFLPYLAGLGLSTAGMANVRAAFASHPAERAKRVFELRPDLRDVFPLGLTPHPDRGRYLGWLVFHGARDLGLTPEEALWFVYETDPVPDRGLVATYRLQPSWQEAVPDGLTAAGWPKLKAYLAGRYGLGSRWFREARLDAPLPPAGGPGANVLGHFRYASGLQEAAFGIVRGLHRVGVQTSLRDLPVKFSSDWRDRERYQGLELFDTTLYVTAVNAFPSLWYPRCGLYPRPGVRRVAVWYWELEELPAEWLDKLGWADEVWAPSEFIAGTFRKAVRVPVVPMLPGVELPAFAPRPRGDFGIPDDRFVFLFSFDMGSVMARKNPLGLIAAYRRAFRPDDRAHLVVKVSRGDADPPSLAKLTAALGPDVTLIDRVMTREDALALLAAADCYASLHRSEGLGLGMAESMLMGKPVIATAYSGNMDFMTPDTAHLVGYRKVPIEDEVTTISPYPKGCLWADPSVEHAAELMRTVYDRPDAARELGRRAKRHAEAVLSLDAAGRRMADRLRQLRADREAVTSPASPSG